MQKRVKSYWGYIRVIVSIVLIGYLLLKSDIGMIASIVKGAEVQYLLLSFLMLLLSIGVSVWRWDILLRCKNVVVNSYELTRLFMIGLFFNNVLPSSIGGDIVKTYKLAKQTSKKSEVISSVVMTRLVGFFSLLAIAGVTVLLGLGKVEARHVIIVFGAMFLLIAGMFTVTRHWFRALARRLSTLPLYPLVRSTYHSIREYRKEKGALTQSFVLAVVFNLLVVAQALLIGVAYGVPLHPYYYFLFIPLIVVFTMLPVSINGIGVRESGFAYFFTPLGVTLEASLTVSLTMYAQLLAASLIGGITYITHRE
jgi:uncharacterized protein (TIRG00374 family)